VAAPPPAATVGEPIPQANTGRFREPTACHDIPFLILFVLTFGGFIACATTALVQHDGVKFPDGLKVDDDKDIAGWISLLTVGAALGGVLALLSMSLLRRWPEQTVNVTLFTQLGLLCVLTCVCIVFGALYAGFMLLILSLLFGLWLYLVRTRIPFAAAMLQIAGRISEEHSSMTTLAVLSLLPQILFLGLAVSAMLSLSNAIDDKQRDSAANNKYAAQILFLALGWFWISQVIRNVVHMSCASVSVTWYNSLDIMSPILDGLKRACGKSFGSICMGSLFVAMVQTLRFIVHTQSNDSFLASCLDCLLSCIEEILRMINKFAFTYIAVYGVSFCDAASDVWELIKERGFDLIINDDITENVLTMLAVIVGLITAVLVGLVALIAGVPSPGLLCLLSGVLAVVVALMALAPIDSAVATLFVCFAEDPGQLHARSPELSAKLSSAWVQHWGQDDWNVRMASTRNGPPPQSVYQAHPVN